MILTELLKIVTNSLGDVLKLNCSRYRLKIFYFSISLKAFKIFNLKLEYPLSTIWCEIIFMKVTPNASRLEKWDLFRCYEIIGLIDFIFFS